MDRLNLAYFPCDPITTIQCGTIWTDLGRLTMRAHQKDAQDLLRVHIGDDVAANGTSLPRVSLITRQIRNPMIDHKIVLLVEVLVKGLQVFVQLLLRKVSFNDRKGWVDYIHRHQNRALRRGAPTHLLS